MTLSNKEKRQRGKLEYLADNEQFIKAWGSDLGKELLSLLVKESDRKRLLIASSKPSDEGIRDEVIAYSVLLKLIEQVSIKVNKYNELQDEILN